MAPRGTRPRPASSKIPFLRGLELQPDRVEDWSSYPFHLPFVRNLRLEFMVPLTFFIGENGSGKTTLLEAVAELCRLPIGGGGRTELADDFRTQRDTALSPGTRHSARASASALGTGTSSAPRTSFASPICSKSANAIPTSGVTHTSPTVGVLCISVHTGKPFWLCSSTGYSRAASSSWTSRRRPSLLSASSRSWRC